MPGRRSNKRIGPFRKRHVIKQKSLEECSSLLEKSTNTEILPMVNKSTNTEILPMVNKSTNTTSATETVLNIGEHEVESFILYAQSKLPPGWEIAETSLPNEKLRLFSIKHTPEQSSNTLPILIAKLLIVQNDNSWTCRINNYLVPTSCSALSCISNKLSFTEFRNLLSILFNCSLCPGNNDRRYIDFCKSRKDKFLSIKKEVVAFLDSTDPATPTVRHVSCDVLILNGKRCSVCQSYRNRLRSMIASFQKSSKSTLSKTNIRFMTTPQRKQKRECIRKKVKGLTIQNKCLKAKLESIIQKDGVNIDSELESDCLAAVSTNQVAIDQLPLNDFQRIFWEQQVSAIKKGNTCSIRWHPLFIRWCLSIMLSSPKTYNIIRESGMLILPSKRTLKDYSNWFKPTIGYQNETFQQLLEDYNIKELNDAQRCVVLGFDEMKIRENLIFDNITGNIVGYVDTGEVNQMLQSFKAQLKGKDHQREIATHMLSVCVRGIFFKLDFPLGQFSTSTVSGYDLCQIIWPAVRRLKEIGLQVVLLVGDGVCNNRLFFKLHSDSSCIKDGVIYKTKNIYDPTKYIWFMSDVCHLLKTTRNCLENSSKNGTRHLEINGKHILWSHIVELYNWSRDESGLYVGNKLKLEHIKLTSYTRMNVRLAAQVLSKSVADLLKMQRDMNPDTITYSVYKDTTETERFCRIFNYFFDCLNTRHLFEAEHKRNDALLPYKSTDDPRLKWLQEQFLGYLNSWKGYALSKQLPLEEINKCMLSIQTLEGLKITVHSFIEMVPYLLSLNGAKYILSEKFNQDNAEIFFAKQRARCGHGDNPTVNQFIYNTQAIRTVRSLSRISCSNIQKRKLSYDDIGELSQPIRKRQRTN